LLSKYNNIKLATILLFLAYYNIIITRICLLKLSIIRALFSISIKSILFIKITSSLVLIFERTYNLAITIFYISLFFLYISIILLEFNFTILDFDLKDFDNKILNILVNNKLRSFFYNASMSIELNFNNFFIEYFLKSCAILFN